MAGKMMSNIVSFDYRRRSLGELQREVEELRAENIRLEDKIEWQRLISDIHEVELSEIKSTVEFLMANRMAIVEEK
jgi:hypothetical protein